MSDLLTMTLARKLQSEADAMVPKFNETGDVDMDAVERMGKLRHDIINSTEQSPMNSLMVFGCIRSVASFLFGVAQGSEQDSEGALMLIQLGLLEILTGLNALQPQLEYHAETSLIDLGLFQDRANLQ